MSEPSPTPLQATSPAQAGGSAQGGAPRRRPLRPWVRTLLELAIAVVVIALVQAFFVKAYQIPSASMEQTLRTGDRILVNRLDDGIERGDIVVFEHGDTWDSTHKSPSENPAVNVLRVIGRVVGLGPSTRAYTVKRVVATGGETVTCCDDQGRITVDGVALEEDYLGSDFGWSAGESGCAADQPSFRCLPQIRVPEGELFVLGDNRTNSADSSIGCRGQTGDIECARFVREAQVIGPVVARFWPPSRIGGVGS